MTISLGVPLVEGFLLGIGLIMGIGPQNSFILQQALHRQFILMIIVLASCIDIGLIMFGANGAADFFAHSTNLMNLMSWTGAGFLGVYGWRAFRAVWQPTLVLETQKTQNLQRRNVITGILAVSLLNPSTYLDTMLVIGGRASHYDETLRLFFVVGASLASILWFFMLTLGAAKLSKLLQRPAVLKILDCLSGLIMWSMASRLLLHSL
jgi:L-lysine exporter family protein LysE/ArgO